MDEEIVAPEGEVQESPVEAQAREYGWKPKEEFEAEEKNLGKKWRTAEDFMDRKSLFDKIDSISQENKTLKKGINALGQHYTNVEKRAFERALTELKAQRKEALENNDLVRAEEIRDEMDDVKQKINSVQAPTVNEPPAEFIEWKARNDWYQRDDRMTRIADALGRDLVVKGYTPDQVLREVEKEMKETFPEKFGKTIRNPNKDTAPEVVTSNKKAAIPSEKGERLSAEEERILTTMIRSGAPITREQYIKDLRNLKGQ
jgi:regulator of replication initiation timing